MNQKCHLFFVILSVFVKIDARPSNIIKRDIANNEIDNADLDQRTFKLPTVVSSGFQIIINGVLDINHKSFVAILKSRDSSSDCKIEYSFTNQMLTVIPPTLADQEGIKYDLELKSEETNTFILKLKAKTGLDSPIIDFTFEGNKHLKTGASDILACKIKNFEDISYIMFKEGVANEYLLHACNRIQHRVWKDNGALEILRLKRK